MNALLNTGTALATDRGAEHNSNGSTTAGESARIQGLSPKDGRPYTCEIAAVAAESWPSDPRSRDRAWTVALDLGETLVVSRVLFHDFMPARQANAS